ncbi:MFS transporter [Demequina muriae]|uniref:MFS transporter n=1 Tax=Demequina muriae TaxID=3051664 RepID=A0ABT8GFG4_9MICO|nr:MFS transporter [Demequina sp. EGI L300058]MDN4479671.1 MFS transporter [Demequina sp. EGI L300058]
MRDDATPDRSPEHPHGYAVPTPGTSASALVPADPTPESAAPGAAPSARPWTPPASSRRSMAALIALAASAFMIVTNEIAPMGLIRLMAADLGRTESEIGLVTTVFAVVAMVTTVPLALLTTRLPRRPLIVATMTFWSAGALVMATADSFTQVLGGRVITAMGHALFWAVVTPAAAGMFAPQMRGRSVTRLMLGASGAGVIGLPMSTWLAQQTDWRVPFWIIGIGGLVLAVTIAVLMPSFRTEQGSAARGDVPSLRRFIRVLLVVLLTTSSMATTWTYITPFFVEVSGFAESTVPVLLALGGATGVVSMWLTGRFLDRWPVRAVALGEAGLVIMWLGLASLGQHKPVAILMVLLQGLAWSLLVAAMLNWALRHTPWSSDIGVGAQASTFNAGNAVGSVLGAAMLAWWGAQWLPLASAVMSAAALALVVAVAPDATRALARRGVRQRR